MFASTGIMEIARLDEFAIIPKQTTLISGVGVGSVVNLRASAEVVVQFISILDSRVRARAVGIVTTVNIIAADPVRGKRHIDSVALNARISGIVVLVVIDTEARVQPDRVDCPVGIEIVDFVSSRFIDGRGYVLLG